MKFKKICIFLSLILFTVGLKAQNTLDVLGLSSTNQANVAFSVRQLSSNYTGPLMRVRVGSSYYDVYPDASADHQISLNSLISAPISFASSITSASANNLGSLGATDAYVAIWYDQSGNTNNLSNLNTVEQPKIISLSSINTDGNNNKPIVYWDAKPRILFLNTNLSNNGQVIIVNKFSTDGFLLGHTSSYYWHSDPPNYLFAPYASESVINGSIFQNANYKSNRTTTNYNLLLGINSVAPSSPNTNTDWNNIGQDRTYHQTEANSGWSEILSFPYKLNQTLRSGVESNQSAYFGITLNPSLDIRPTFNNPTGPITLCQNGTYFLDPSTTNGTFSSSDPLVATVNSSGYITAVAASGSSNISLTTNEGFVSIAVTVGSTSSVTITDNTAKPNYKFDGSPFGPADGTVNYVGYNGFKYYSQSKPTNTGYYRASKQDGNNSGCPVPFYIIKCDVCGISVTSNGLIQNLDANNSSSYSGNGNTWFDLTGYGNNGINFNNINFSTSNGISYFEFVGNSTITAPINKTGSMTFNIWAKANTLNTNNMLFNAGNNNQGPDLFFGQNLVALNTWDSWANPYYNYNTNPFDVSTISLNNWHFYSVVIDQISNNSLLYIDGILKGSSHYVSPLYSDPINFYIGSSGVGTYGWDGKISVVQTYNRVLSPSEIQQNFNSLKSKFGM